MALCSAAERKFMVSELEGCRQNAHTFIAGIMMNAIDQSLKQKLWKREVARKFLCENSKFCWSIVLHKKDVVHQLLDLMHFASSSLHASL